MTAEGSVFIKIDRYKEVSNLIKAIQKRIYEGKKIVEKINDLKKREDSEIEQWSAELNQIESRIGIIDSRLFEPDI